MRILILTQNYVPEPDTKMHVLGRALHLRGHAITVITGYPNYPEGRIYSGYRQRVWHTEVLDGVRIVRVPLYPDHSRSAVRRSLNYLSFAVSASMIGPVAYAGNMWPAQHLQNVVEAAALLTDLPDVQFLLIGDGVERLALEKTVRARQLKNVRVEPRQPMDEMPGLYAQADALLIHLSA